MNARKLKFIGLLVALLACGTVFFRQESRARRLEADAAMLREQAKQTAILREENLRLAEQWRVASERSKADASELLRLRGQSVRMRQAEQENVRLRAERDRLAQRKPASAGESQEAAAPDTPEGILRRAKGMFGKDLGLAILLSAEANGGNVPTELRGPLFGLVESLSAGAEHDLRVKHFELVYQGSLNDVKDTHDTILAREKEPMQLADGQWVKVYVMADGSARYIAAGTRDGFPAREKELWPNQFKP